MKSTIKTVMTGTLGLLLLAGTAGASKSKQPRRSSVEVVFVLDTTGSMGGLLESAKQKVWSIANEIAKGKPAPKIRMGLIAYRDKGDKYVTKVFDLTTNLDKMYEELLGLKADGGGDGPEHVLKGIEDAVERISWSADKKTFKVVYVVGDAPAHLDYQDSPQLQDLTQRAVRKGLILNTVQCGSDRQTAEQWQRIARLGEGKFLAIAHNGGVVAVATPFDGELTRLSSRLDGTMLGYGRRKHEAEASRGLARKVASLAPAAAAADRASFKAARGFAAEMDLAAAVEEGAVDLEALKQDALPDELKKLTPKERRAEIAKINGERAKLRGRIKELSVQRARYIKEKGAESKDSFDAKLMESLKAQATLKGIRY
ncbi:MAG: vWA domain-containing protein [Elusimicrobiota bacterium]